MLTRKQAEDLIRSQISKGSDAIIYPSDIDRAIELNGQFRVEVYPGHRGVSGRAFTNNDGIPYDSDISEEDGDSEDYLEILPIRAS